MNHSTKPLFTTGVTAQIVGTKPKTIINYECADLIEAHRTPKNRRLFSKKDIFDILLIRYLLKEKELTFKAVKYIFEVMKNLENDKINAKKYFFPKKKLEEFEELVKV